MTSARKPWLVPQTCAAIVVLVLSVLGLLGLVATGTEGCSEAEIAYDDGTAEAGRGYGIAGGGFAVRFTPPAEDCVLLRARIHLTGFVGEPAEIEVHVWDAGHNDLMLPIRVQTTSKGWLDVDLLQYEIRPAADIYVGYLQTSADNHPWLGVDQTTSTDRSYSLPDWTALLPHGASAMIRIVLGGSQTADATIVLAHDDGVAETGRGFSMAGAGYAVRFTPPTGGARLLAARVYVTDLRGVPAPIAVSVMTAHGEPLAPPVSATATSSGWLDVDLSALALSPTTDFLVGYSQTESDNYPWVGLDTTSSNDRSYAWPEPTSLEPTEEGNVMIRAVMAQTP